MKNSHVIWASFLAAALAACGGGGSSSDTTAAAPMPTQLTLSGTAAKGAAIAGATVEVKCASGTTTTTTDSSGKFSLSLATGVLPCALKVPTGDGSFLYSAIGGSGSGSFTVNVSPLTQLIVAQAIGVSPATLFDEFATRVTSVTTASLADALVAVKTTLAAAGIDLANINPLSDTLVVGDAQDLKIDALVTTLSDSGTSLAQLTETVVAASPVNTTVSTTTAPATATSGTPSLPAELLLKPAAANCAALRSGDYRVVLFESSAAGQYATQVITINAATLSVDNHDGAAPGTLIPVGTCRFTNANGSELIVSQAGVVAIRGKNDAGVYRNGIAFPEQAHSVAELAGVWNSLGFERDSNTASTFHNEAATLTFGSDGKINAVTSCSDVKTCTDLIGIALPPITLSVNTAGGFNFTNTNPAEPYVDRIFAYRAGGGELMVVDISGGGSFSLWTHQRTNTLPTVGVASRSFDMSVGSNLMSAGVITESGNTIKTIDATSAPQAFTRTVFGYFNSGTTFATWDQSLQANQPRAGYTYRLAETGVPTSATGVTTTTREFIALGLRGMGLSAVAIPFNNSYIVSVGQPGGPLLPPELIAKPFAANCSAARSGTYRVVSMTPAAAGQFSTNTVTINAATLQFTSSTGFVGTLTPTGNCRFTSSGGSDIVVAQSGVLAIRDGGGYASIAFPEQAHTVAELAGTWNKLGYNTTANGTFAADAATATIDTAGSVTTTISYCVDVANCVDVTGKTFTHAVNAAGGFDRTSSDGWTDRVFAYRAGNGDLMLVNIGGAGDIGFWTQQRTNALPTVGAFSRSWDLYVDPRLLPSLSENATTIASVDSTAGTAVRTRKTVTGASYSETLKLNNPRIGYTFRPAATVTASDASTVNVREFTALVMRGMGFAPLKFVGATEQALIISVSKP